METTTKISKKSILNPIEVCEYMPNSVKLYVGDPKENKYFLIDNDQGLINYLTQNAFRWTFDSNSNKDYGLLSASSEECKEIYGKTTIRLHQLVFQYYFGDTEEFKEYKEQEYFKRKSKRLVIEHLNNDETDNRIQNLHITTQETNKNKSIIDDLIDYNKCYIYYPINDQGQRIYKDRKYIIQFNCKPGLTFRFGDQKKYCNTFTISFGSKDFDKYLEAVEKISTLTKQFLQKNEEAKEIRKLVKEADQEERRATFSNLLENKTSSVVDLEAERTRNLQELVNKIYSTIGEENRVKSYLVMPLIDVCSGFIHQIRVEDVEREIVKIINVDPVEISNKNITDKIKGFCFADFV